MDEIEHITGKLSSSWWIDYVKQAQRKADRFDPRYVVLLPEGYRLTPKGEELLPPRFTEAILETLQVNGDMPENELILRLDVRDLSFVAFEKEIPPQVMIGTVATYIDQAKMALPPISNPIEGH